MILVMPISAAAPKTGFFRIAIAKDDQAALTPESIKVLVQHMLGARHWKDVFDPCPVNPQYDGLSIPWKRLNYINPPFGDVRKWISKAQTEMQHSRSSVLLLPARTYTVYFLQDLFPVSKTTQLFILTTNVRFAGYKQSFPLPIMLAVYGRPARSLPGDKYICRTLRAGILDTRGISAQHPHFHSDMEVIGAHVQSQGLRFDFIHLCVTAATQLAAGRLGTFNFAIILGDTYAVLKEVWAHHEKVPSAFTAVVVMARYQTVWMRGLVDRSHSVFFVVPPLMVDDRQYNRRSLSGSAVFLIGPVPSKFPLRPVRDVNFMCRNAPHGSGNFV